MFCNKCGRELADGSAFCSGCGNRIEGGGSPNYLKTTFDTQQSGYTPNNNVYSGGGENAGGGTFHCPRCKSTNLDIISSTEVNTSSKGGFSICKGFFGFLCLGPLGILCGACSKTKVNATVKTKTAWVCKNCAHRFKDELTLNKEIEAAKNSARIMGIVAIALAVIAIAQFTPLSRLFGVLYGIMPFIPNFPLVAISFLIGAIVCYIMHNGFNKEVSELEAQKAELNN